MGMSAQQIERLIRGEIPDAEVTIVDLAGDGGKVDQARAVGKALAEPPQG